MKASKIENLFAGFNNRKPVCQTTGINTPKLKCLVLKMWWVRRLVEVAEVIVIMI